MSKKIYSFLTVCATWLFKTLALRAASDIHQKYICLCFHLFIEIYFKVLSVKATFDAIAYTLTFSENLVGFSFVQTNTLTTADKGLS